MINWNANIMAYFVIVFDNLHDFAHALAILALGFLGPVTIPFNLFYQQLQ